MGPQDVIDITVFKVPELTKTVQVAETGTINLPLLNEVEAAGRTAQELERDLTTKLGAKYLQKPQVSVMVREYNSQRITLEGAIKKPGVYPIRGNSSLLQAIAAAEGLSELSDTTVVVFRTTNGRRSAARFDLAEIRSGQTADPKLMAGDVVIAPTSMMKETYNALLKALPIATIFAVL